MVPIRRHARNWRAYFACAGLALVIGATSPPSGNPAQRGPENTKANDAKTNQNSSQVKPFAAVSEVGQNATGNVGSSSPATQHEDESGPKWTDMVVAFAAFASAILAFALWRSTDKLWEETKRLATGAEAQSADFKRSIDASEITAKATEAAANAAIQQAEISTTVLRDLERPYVFFELHGITAREWRFGHDSLSFMFQFTNHGRSPAIIKDIRGRVTLGPRHLDDPMLEDRPGRARSWIESLPRPHEIMSHVGSEGVNIGPVVAPVAPVDIPGIQLPKFALDSFDIDLTWKQRDMVLAAGASSPKFGCKYRNRKLPQERGKEVDVDWLHHQFSGPYLAAWLIGWVNYESVLSGEHSSFFCRRVDLINNQVTEEGGRAYNQRT